MPGHQSEPFAMDDLDKDAPLNFVATSAVSPARHIESVPGDGLDQARHIHFAGQDGFGSTRSAPPLAAVDPEDPGEQRVDEIRNGNKFLSKLRDMENFFDRKLRFEAMGVERLPEDSRFPPQIINASGIAEVLRAARRLCKGRIRPMMMLFWFSLLFSPTMIPIGVLAPKLGLSVHKSVLITIIATLLGTIWPAFTGTLSPRTGLRQIAVARYAFGVYGSKLCGGLNIFVNVGYASIACIIGGSLITAVSEDQVPLAVGIIVMAVVSFCISFLGYRIIQVFERYAWVTAFILLCIVWAQTSPTFTRTPNVGTASGLDEAGAALTYFAIVFGVACSWCPMTGDYYVHYPANVNPWLVFGLTFMGQAIPMIFVGLLGNYLGGAIEADSELLRIYGRGNLGPLFLHILPVHAWAKMACILFSLSFVGNLVANLYSAALCAQLWGKHCIAVPRSAWCLLMVLVVLGMALGGRERLEDYLYNVLSLLGYWTLSFGVILFTEHFLFRPRLGGYDLAVWQDARRMPLGAAATGTLLIVVAFAFLGTNQTWYQGPAARLVGSKGGDLAPYICFVATFFFYPIFRSIEISYARR